MHKIFIKNKSPAMYLLFIFLFMLLLLIVMRDVHQQVLKCLKITNTYNYGCLYNIKIHTLLLRLMNGLQSFECRKHESKCMCVHVCMYRCVCVCVCVCAHAHAHTHTQTHTHALRLIQKIAAHSLIFL